MNIIKLIILANNKNDNLQINSILKNIKFKKIFVTILYSNNNYFSKKSFYYKKLFELMFIIERKFINLNNSLINKKNISINKKNIIFNKHMSHLSFNNNKKYLTDVVIDLGNHNIDNLFIKRIKYGIWYLNHGVKNNFYIGFFDCLFNKRISTSYLIKKETFDNKIVKKYIDVAYLNNKTNFWLRNKQFILDKSTNLISKNLNKIFYGIKIIDHKLSFKEHFFEIKLKNLFTYYFQKYFLFTLKKYNLFKKKEISKWALHICDYNKNYVSKNKVDITESSKIISKKSEWWADPFIFTHMNKDYVFFENFEFDYNKAKISYGEIKNTKIVNVNDALSLNYHLSYPFIWKDKNNIYLIPETAEKKSIQVWKAKKFPNQWVHFKTLLKGEVCCDTSIVQDKSKNKWLFTNKSNDKSNDANNELYIYKIVGNFKKLIPHKLNPVITDCRRARNAGNLFIKNQLLRPSQINDSRGYGLGININKITILNLSTYEEKIIKKIFPKKIKDADGLHHISNSNNHLAFDVRYKI